MSVAEQYTRVELNGAEFLRRVASAIKMTVGADTSKETDRLEAMAAKLETHVLVSVEDAEVLLSLIELYTPLSHDEADCEAISRLRAALKENNDE